MEDWQAVAHAEGLRDGVKDSDAVPLPELLLVSEGERVPEEHAVSVSELDPEGQGEGEMELDTVAVGQPVAALDCVTEGEEVGEAVAHTVVVPVPAAEGLMLALEEGEGVAMGVSEGDWLVESDVLPVMEPHSEGEAVAAHVALAPPVVLRDGEVVAEWEAVTEAEPLLVAVGHSETLDVNEADGDAVPLNEAPAVAVMEGRVVTEVLDEAEVLPEALPAPVADVSALVLVLGEAAGEALAVPRGLCVSVGRALGDVDEEALAVAEAEAQPETVRLPEGVGSELAEGMGESVALAVAHPEELTVADTDAEALLELQRVPASGVGLALSLGEAVGGTVAVPLAPGLRDTLTDGVEEAETLRDAAALGVSPGSEGVRSGEGLGEGLCASDTLAVWLTEGQAEVLAETVAWLVTVAGAVVAPGVNVNSLEAVPELH